LLFAVFDLFGIPLSFFILCFIYFLVPALQLTLGLFGQQVIRTIALLLLLLLALGHCFEFLNSERKSEMYSPQHHTQVVSGSHSTFRKSGSDALFR